MWPNAGRWPKPDRAWVQHGQWFTMWRRSRRTMKVEARKQLKVKRANSCAKSDASWDAISQCSDVSWQRISEVSDASWMELATEAEILAHMEAKAAAAAALKKDCQKDLDEAMPALREAVASLDCLSKADLIELKSLAKPPMSVILVVN